MRQGPSRGERIQESLGTSPAGAGQKQQASPGGADGQTGSRQKVVLPSLQVSVLNTVPLPAAATPQTVIDPVSSLPFPGPQRNWPPAPRSYYTRSKPGSQGCVE